MKPLVKICGVRDAKTARAAADAGADMLGFMDFARSPRHLTLDQAKALAPQLPDLPYRAGVFVDAPLDEIRAYAEALDLTHAQLHGSESVADIRAVKDQLDLTVIKVIGVANAADVEKARAFEGDADVLLFDAKPPAGAAMPGGNAISFSWALLAGKSFRPVTLLAGGLNPDNAADALAASGVDGLDVSSGVETAPGIKSQALIQAFLKAAKSAR